MTDYNASWVLRQRWSFGKTNHSLGHYFLYFLSEVWFYTLCFGTLWHYLIKDANQVLGWREHIWWYPPTCSLKVLTLLFPLPLIFGIGKRRGGILYPQSFMNQTAAAGYWWFWSWTYFRRKVKVKENFIMLRGSFKNHVYSLMAGFLWEGNSKLLFSFASFSLRGSWWRGMGKLLASRMVKQRGDTCLQDTPFCAVNLVQILREINSDME